MPRGSLIYWRYIFLHCVIIVLSLILSVEIDCNILTVQNFSPVCLSLTREELQFSAKISTLNTSVCLFDSL